MKKILIISNFYYPHIGGIEQTAHDCAEALKDLCEIKVICFNGCNKDIVEYIDDVEVYKCAANYKISSQVISMSFGKTLCRLLHSYRPNIVIFNYPNPYAAHYILRYISKSTKFILYWHSDIIKQKILRSLFVYQNHRLLKRADAVIATSPNYIRGSKYLRSYRNKCCVIPSCINIGRLKLKPDEIVDAMQIRQQYGNDIICIAIGRHVEYKGFEYLIKASEFLKSNITLLMVGEGPLTEKMKRIAEDNPKVIFLGRLSDKDLRKHLYISDIYCFPSITKNEAFGLSLAEAMYFEKPVVTFTIKGSGVNFVSLDGKTGIEVKNRDIIQLATAINKLADSPKLRQKYGEGARHRVEENFMFDKFQERLKILVSKV